MPDVNRLSASQVDTYRMCSLKWAFRYVHRARPEQRGSALVIGTTVDVALKCAFHDLREGSVSIETLAPAPYAERAWEAELESTDVSVNWGRSDEASARAMTVALVTRFLEREDLADYVRSIEALDVGFEVPLRDPETGSETGIQLRGVLDVVIRDSEGRLTVLDLKTSGSRSRWSQSALRFHLQGSCYALAIPKIYPDQPVSDTVLFDVGFKLKAPTWERKSVTLGSDAQRRALRTILASHHGMSHGVAIPTPGWGCPTCPHAERCATWHHAAQPQHLMDVFATSVLSASA